MKEVQNVKIDVLNESSVIDSMKANGWKLVNKTQWSEDQKSYVGVFEKSERVQLNG